MTADADFHGAHRRFDHRRVIVLGDTETADSVDLLRQQAGQQGALIAEIHAFDPGEAIAHQDLGEVEAVAAALGRAITIGADIWVPFPPEDLGLEQHVRRLDLVLRRHGRALLLGHQLELCPEDGPGTIDRALRAEVHAVNALHDAALAAAAVRPLCTQIAHALSAASAAESENRDDHPTPLSELEAEYGPSPRIPAPNAPWIQRQPALKSLACWLVGNCGLTQREAAEVINSTGHRTPRRRAFRQATVSMLLRGGYAEWSAA